MSTEKQASPKGSTGTQDVPHVSTKGDPVVPSSTPQHVHDAMNLSSGQLKKKYPLTFNTHRNMKQRRHDGAVIHPEFEKFPSFIIQMGPRPSKDHTLDRLNNDDPEYGPGKCEWRNKSEQNANKLNSIHLTDENGISRPLIVVAKETSQKPNTMRKRRLNGWTDVEVIRGERGHTGPPNTTPQGLAIWPSRTLEGRKLWESKYQGEKEHGETRNRFLLRRSRDRMHEVIETGEFDHEGRALGETLERLTRLDNIIRICMEREARLSAPKPAQQDPYWNDPYA